MSWWCLENDDIRQHFDEDGVAAYCIRGCAC